MASFEWRFSTKRVPEGAYEIRISESSPYWELMTEITIYDDPNWGQFTILFTWEGSDKSHMWEEDPQKHDEEGKTNMRSLLRKLGYQRKHLWKWVSPHV